MRNEWWAIHHCLDKIKFMYVQMSNGNENIVLNVWWTPGCACTHSRSTYIIPSTIHRTCHIIIFEHFGTDEIKVPVDLYTNKTFLLPHCYYCYQLLVTMKYQIWRERKKKKRKENNNEKRMNWQKIKWKRINW